MTLLDKAVTVVAVMVIVCGRHGLWPSWSLFMASWFVAIMVKPPVTEYCLGYRAACCVYVQPPNVKDEEDIDGTVMDDVDGIPLEELDGTPLDGEPLKDKTDDDVNGIPLKSIVPYGDDIDGEPGTEAVLY